MCPSGTVGAAGQVPQLPVLQERAAAPGKLYELYKAVTNLHAVITYSQPQAQAVLL